MDEPYELSPKEIINAINTLNHDEFVNALKDISCVKLSHGEILLHLMLQIQQLQQKLQQQQQQHEECNQEDRKLASFFTALFKETVKQTDLTIVHEFFKLRLSHASLGLQSLNCEQLGITNSFTLLLNHITPDVKSTVYKRLISEVVKWACFAPVEMTLFLIDRAILTPSLIPTIAQIVTGQLRPIVTFKADKSPCTLMASLLNYKLFFSIDNANHQLQSKFNSRFVQLVKEFFKSRYLKGQSCIVSIEVVVIEWLTIVKTFPATVLTQIDVLNQLITCNLEGKLLWSYICLTDLLVYFVTCIIELRKRANVKEVFLRTIDRIMKNYIQRKITCNEIDQLFTQVHPSHYILLTYFNDFTEEPSYILHRLHLKYNCMNKHEIMLLASIVGPEDILMQKTLPNVVESVKCILPFMTTKEIVNLFAFFSSIYGIENTIGFFVSALEKFPSQNSMGEHIDWIYVVSCFDLAVRLLAFPSEQQSHSYENTGDDINPSVILPSDQVDAGSSSSPKEFKVELKDQHKSACEGKQVTSSLYSPSYPSTTLTSSSLKELTSLTTVATCIEKHLNGNRQSHIVQKRRGIYERVNKLLNIVPLDCRAIVCKLQEDLRGNDTL